MTKQRWPLSLLALCVPLLAGCPGRDIIAMGAPVRASILRHASLAGIEAKGFVGEPIEKAIERYGKAQRVVDSTRPPGSMVRGVDLHGKTLWLFERDRTNYTIDVPTNSQTVQTGQGLVTVNEYERQARVAICEVGFVVEPSTRLILDYELQGNCL